MLSFKKIQEPICRACFTTTTELRGGSSIAIFSNEATLVFIFLFSWGLDAVAVWQRCRARIVQKAVVFRFLTPPYLRRFFLSAPCNTFWQVGGISILHFLSVDKKMEHAEMRAAKGGCAATRNFE